MLWEYTWINDQVTVIFFCVSEHGGDPSWWQAIITGWVTGYPIFRRSHSEKTMQHKGISSIDTPPICTHIDTEPIFIFRANPHLSISFIVKPYVKLAFSIQTIIPIPKQHHFVEKTGGQWHEQHRLQQFHQWVRGLKGWGAMILPWIFQLWVPKIVVPHEFRVFHGKNFGNFTVEIGASVWWHV